jgi:hypothetical protein
MAAYDILKYIVRSGCDLTLNDGVAYDTIRELASLAKQSGAHLTVTTEMSQDFIRELCDTYGKSISFVNGLDRFEKDK